MLFTLLAVSFVVLMQGHYVLQTLLWAIPVAYLATAFWAVFELRRKPAEIVIRHGLAMVRSVWDVARDPKITVDEGIRFVPVFSARRIEGSFSAAIGDQLVAILPEEWPRFRELTRALQKAAVDFETGHIIAS